MRVLVVNDDSSILPSIKEYLSSLQLEKVYFVDNFLECQEVITSENINILLLDSTFLKNSDDSILEKIGKLLHNFGLYSLIVTDNLEEENISRFLKVGFNDFILKPLEKSVFIAKMKFAQNQNKRTKNLEFQLLHKQKLASIGELSAGVAHEVNNAITFVGGNIDILSRYVMQLKLVMKEYRAFFIKYQDLGTDVTNKLEATSFKSDLKDLLEFEAKSKIDYIINELDGVISDSRTGVSNITKIASNLKNYTRYINNDKKESYLLNDIVNECVFMVSGEAKPNIDIEVTSTNVPSNLFNRVQISQVILNILINGIQALKCHESFFRGKIKVKTFEDDKYVICSIQDNGPGIPDDVLPNIFEPFYTTKDIDVGSGLGLSIAYDIVNKKHKGELSVTSLIGEGTTFFVKLPK